MEENKDNSCINDPRCRKLLSILANPQSIILNNKLIWEPKFEKQMLNLVEDICSNSTIKCVTLCFNEIRMCSIIYDIELDNYSNIFVDSGKLDANQFVTSNATLLMALFEEPTLKLKVILHLLKRPLNPNVRNKDGSTAFDIFVHELCADDYSGADTDANKFDMATFLEIINLFERNEFLSNKNLTRDTYNTLVNMIENAMQKYEEKIDKIVNNNSSRFRRSRIDKFLKTIAGRPSELRRLRERYAISNDEICSRYADQYDVLEILLVKLESHRKRGMIYFVELIVRNKFIIVYFFFPLLLVIVSYLIFYVK